MHGDLAEALDNKKLHGMLLFARCSDQQEEWLKSYGVPLVIYSEWGNHDWKVMTDYEVFSRQAVELLHQQGCRKIGMISLGVNHHSFFLNALKEFNLKAYPQWIVSAPSGKTAGNQEHFGRVEALRIIDHMNKNGRPDGIVISDDVMAVGACQAFEEKGFTPGKSIGFVTLSNKGSWSLREWHDKISRIEFNPSDYVDSAFYLLDLLMAGQKLERRIIKIRPEAIYPVEPTLTP
jgi:DNA-binding LacI/PurR family transcriptional regulator